MQVLLTNLHKPENAPVSYFLLHLINEAWFSLAQSLISSRLKLLNGHVVRSVNSCGAPIQLKVVGFQYRNLHNFFIFLTDTFKHF